MSPTASPTPSSAFAHGLNASEPGSFRTSSATSKASLTPGAVENLAMSTVSRPAFKSNAVLNAASIFLKSTLPFSSTVKGTGKAQIVLSTNSTQAGSVVASVSPKSKSTTLTTSLPINSHAVFDAAGVLFHAKGSLTSTTLSVASKKPSTSNHQRSPHPTATLPPRQVTKSRVHSVQHPHNPNQEKITTSTRTTTIAVTITVTAGGMGYIS